MPRCKAFRRTLDGCAGLLTCIFILSAANASVCRILPSTSTSLRNRASMTSALGFNSPSSAELAVITLRRLPWAKSSRLVALLEGRSFSEPAKSRSFRFVLQDDIIDFIVPSIGIASCNRLPARSFMACMKDLEMFSQRVPISWKLSLRRSLLRSRRPVSSASFGATAWAAELEILESVEESSVKFFSFVSSKLRTAVRWTALFDRLRNDQQG